VTSGPVRNNQDQRVVTDPAGNAYLTFDNGIQGGKGTALYVSKLARGSSTWSAPIAFGMLTDPTCLFPPTCFNISGGAFRAGGSYPVPAFDTKNGRLYVSYADIKGTYSQTYVQSAPATDLRAWSAPKRWPPHRATSSRPSSARLPTGASTCPSTTAGTAPTISWT